MTQSPLAWQQLSRTTALVFFCDLQKNIVKESKTTTPRALANSAGALLQLAKLYSLPVIKSVVPEGSSTPQLIAELRDDVLLAPQITRSSVSLIADRPTQEAIAASQRKVLVVSGFMLEAVVLLTVLDAIHTGYSVIVAVDACGSTNSRTEAAALKQMESAGAVASSVVSIGCKLSPDLSSTDGQKMFHIVGNIHGD